MSDTAHPSLDSLADHHVGLLSGDVASRVETHLVTCTQCRALEARLDDVSTILADDGQTRTTMPAAVAMSLEEAIGREAAARTGGQVVVPMDGHRAPKYDERRSSGRAWPLLAAAAAVVVASSIGVSLVQDDLGSGDAGSSGSSADKSAGGGRSDAGARPESDADPERAAEPLATLDSSTVLRYADQVAAGRLKPAPVPARCATPPAESSEPRTHGLISYAEQRAVLSIDESARRLTVYACDAADEVLFRHGY